MPSLRSAFVVGCGHSGTSLIIRVLGSHSNVYAIPGETRLFIDNQEGYIFDQLTNFDKIAKKKGKILWIEKTPKHIMEVDNILSFRDNAKIIAIVRDPRDVACSIKARGFSFEEGLLRWIEDNNFLIKHKDKKEVFILKLEDFVSAPKLYIKRLLDHLCLPYEDLTKYHLQKKDWYSNEFISEKPECAKRDYHEKLRNWQINQPIFSKTSRYMLDMCDEDWKILRKHANEVEEIAKNFSYFLE